MDCGQIDFSQWLKNNGSDSADPNPFDVLKASTIGDLPYTINADAKFMERCSGEYLGCSFVYYHNYLESDDFFDHSQGLKVLLINKLKE